MRLSNLKPYLPTQLVPSLEAIGIKTEVDLLFAHSVLDIYQRLPAGSFTYQELLDFVSHVEKSVSAPAITGSSLLRQEEQANAKEWYTGLRVLDAFLNDLQGGRVIEISGDKWSGKTTLALNTTLYRLSRNSTDFVSWMDTTGDFPAARASQVLASEYRPEVILDRLKVSLAFDIDAAREVLESIASGGYRSGHPAFLVIDTISPLFAPLLSVASAQGHAIMIDFMRQLQLFAQSTGITVVVLNNTSRKSPDSQERKPALGPSFALLPDTSLWLRCLGPNPDRDQAFLHSLEVRKSSSMEIGRTLTFHIQESRLIDA